MAYPGEQEHKDYLDYLERWSTGQESGPKLSKEEWIARKPKPQPKPNTGLRPVGLRTK